MDAMVSPVAKLGGFRHASRRAAAHETNGLIWRPTNECADGTFTKGLCHDPIRTHPKFR